MLNFSKVPVIVSKEFVLDKVNESTIFSNYFGNFDLRKNYHSPFRRTKKHTTGFFVNKNGNIIFHDFSTGEKWDAFAFVAQLHMCSYYQAVTKVAEDFGLIGTGDVKFDNKVAYKIDLEVKKKTLIQFVPAEWSDVYINYFKKFNIEFKDIPQNQIFPVKELWINKKFVPTKEIRFAYVQEYKSEIYTKIYSPFSTEMKWLSNFPLSVPFGLDSLQYKSDTVFISKSVKEWMLLKTIFTDVVVVQNESESAISEELQKHLKQYFEKCIIIFDADDVGVLNCKKFNEKGFGYFNTPKEDYELFGIKDVAEYSEWYGKEELIKLFINKDFYKKGA